ncbi:MAG: hypothetical protein ACRD01_02935 [Terriglobales bacterium]
MKLTRDGELRVEQAHPYVMVGDLGGGRLMLRGGYHRAYAYMLTEPSPTEPFLAALTEDKFTELEIPG